MRADTRARGCGVRAALPFRYTSVTVAGHSRRAVARCRRGTTSLTATSERPVYIDPAAGSMILQMLAAGLVSVLALAKNVRRNIVLGIKSLFGRRASR